MKGVTTETSSYASLPESAPIVFSVLLYKIGEKERARCVSKKKMCLPVFFVDIILFEITLQTIGVTNTNFFMSQ